MKSESLIRLAGLGLSSVQMNAVLEVLAAELAPLEAFRAGAAERTRRYHSHGAARITPALRSAVYERDGSFCIYCGSGQDLTCDHVIPVSKGGQTTLENLVTACRPCNSRKKDRERKRDARSVDNGRTTDGQGTDNAIARVEDKPLPYNNTEISQIDTPHNPPIEPSGTSHETFSALTEGWNQFWANYPKRAGGRDKQNAFKAFRAASKRADIETIIAGAQAYAAYCNSTGKAGTEFIRQARTWLNANGWTEDYNHGVAHAKSPATNLINKFLNG